MARKKKGQNKGRFAGIPIQMMETQAYIELSNPAKVLLYELSAQYSGSNNGYLSLTRDDLKLRGFPTPNVVTKSIKELLNGKFISQTRFGGLCYGRSYCSLYAINWQPLDERIDKPFEVKVVIGVGFINEFLKNTKPVKIINRSKKLPVLK